MTQAFQTVSQSEILQSMLAPTITSAASFTRLIHIVIECNKRMNNIVKHYCTPTQYRIATHYSLSLHVYKQRG